MYLATVILASVVTLKRSNTAKSFAERYGDTPPTVVLPPPETFGDATPTSGGGQQRGGGGAYPIDTSTAKAIIDTYSGNLFSRSTNYYSFREKQALSEQPEVDQDSLEVPASNGSQRFIERPEPYGMEETGLPLPHLNHNRSPVKYHTMNRTNNSKQANKNRLQSNHSMSKKTRTESVV